MTFDDSCDCDPQGHEMNNEPSADQRFMLSRRKLLGGMLGAGIVTMMGSSPASAALRALATPGANDDRVLINIFLRGGADGLNIVVPYGDADYYRHRQSIAQQRSNLSDLDGFFGLNKAFEPLHALYREGEAAFIHAAGSPTPEGSHFAAMDNIDFAFGNGGWMERALTVAQQTAPVSALTISPRSAPALRGSNGGVAFESLDKFRRSSRQLSSMRSALENMYGASGDPLTSAATLKAFSAVDTLSGVTSSRNTSYPTGKLGAQLREAAALIKADIGVRMIAINYGGWDHHSNETTRMNAGGAQLSGALAAFQQDLGGAKSRVMTVVMSEFGRTAGENGSGGTDHGYGSLMTVVGTGLRSAGGGQVHLRDNRWVGLSDDDLERNRNLAVSTDFRSVASELLEHHMGIVDDGRIFPGYARQPVGLFSASSPAPPDNRPTGDGNTTSTTQNPTTSTQPADTQAPSSSTPNQTSPGQSGGSQAGSGTSTASQTTTASNGGTRTGGQPGATQPKTATPGATSSPAGQTTGSGATTSGGNAGAMAADKPAPLVVNAQGSTAATAGSTTGAAVPAATGATSTSATTAAASGATTVPNLALGTGVEQSAAGGLGLGKVAPAAAAGAMGAAALAGGVAWKKRPQADPLMYLAMEGAEKTADPLDDEQRLPQERRTR